MNVHREEKIRRQWQRRGMMKREIGTGQPEKKSVLMNGEARRWAERVPRSAEFTLTPTRSVRVPCTGLFGRRSALKGAADVDDCGTAAKNESNFTGHCRWCQVEDTTWPNQRPRAQEGCGQKMLLLIYLNGSLIGQITWRSS